MKNPRTDETQTHDQADAFEVADLLVRCSGVPLPRIAAVLGFAQPTQFSDWFLGRCGHHPEAARATWTQARTQVRGKAAQKTDGRGPDDALLFYLRRVFAAREDRSEMIRVLRDLRSRNPLSYRA